MVSIHDAYDMSDVGAIATDDTCWIIPLSKWLITMVRFRSLRIGLFPFQMAFLWLINEGDPNHVSVRPGMILQAGRFSHCTWASSLWLSG